MSSLLEMREAARFALVPWHVFLELDDEERGGIIAHYRVIHRLKAVEAHTTIEESKIRSKVR